jgi:hypothetical protein
MTYYFKEYFAHRRRDVDVATIAAELAADTLIVAIPALLFGGYSIAGIVVAVIVLRIIYGLRLIRTYIMRGLANFFLKQSIEKIIKRFQEQHFPVLTDAENIEQYLTDLANNESLEGHIRLSAAKELGILHAPLISNPHLNGNDIYQITNNAFKEYTEVRGNTWN